MQVVQMDMNPENRVKRVKGNQHSKAGSKGGDDPGRSRKFAEVYEHLLAASQTSVSASGTRQPGNDKTPEQTLRSPGERLLRLNIPVQASMLKSGERRVMGKQAKLWGAAVLQTPGTAKTGKKTGEVLQQIKTAEPQGSERAGRVFTHTAARSNADETPRPAGTMLKQFKPAEPKGSERAGRVFTHTAARSNAEVTPRPAGTMLKQFKPAEPKGSESTGRKFTQTAARSNAEVTPRPAGTMLKQFKPAEPQGSERTGRKFTQTAVRPAVEEDVIRTVKDVTHRKNAEAKAFHSTDRKIFNETRQGIGRALTFIGNEVKNDSQAAEVQPIKQEMKGGHGSQPRNILGEVSQLKPEVNNIKAPELTAADKNVMSKFQIDFIVAALMGQIKSGASGLEVDLKPEYLGRIKLLLDMKDGLVSVRIIANNAETMVVMNSSMPDIQERLEQQGIRLNNMSVDLAGQQKQEKQTGSGSREGNRSGNYFSESQEDRNNTGSWEQSYFQAGILNILA